MMQDEEVSVHIYPQEALKADYLRTALGLLMSIPLALLGAGGLASFLFAAVALVFAAFGALTFLRQATAIELHPEGLRRRLRPDWPKRLFPLAPLIEHEIDFGRLEALKLRHYGPRRAARGRGHFEISLSAGGVKLAVEDRIDGFFRLARVAARAAAARGLELDAATKANLDELGLE